jgi:hypothetical protein
LHTKYGSSLVSIRSTAPFLQNNSLGRFEWSPSVDARMRSFQPDLVTRQFVYLVRIAADAMSHTPFAD